MSEIPNGIICPRCIPMICDLETNFQEFEVFIILSKGLPGRMATAPSLIIATCCEVGASFIMMKWQGNKNKEWSSTKTSNCLLFPQAYSLSTNSPQAQSLLSPAVNSDSIKKCVTLL